MTIFSLLLFTSWSVAKSICQTENRFCKNSFTSNMVRYKNSQSQRTINLSCGVSSSCLNLHHLSDNILLRFIYQRHKVFCSKQTKWKVERIYLFPSFVWYFRHLINMALVKWHIVVQSLWLANGDYSFLWAGIYIYIYIYIISL